MGMGVKFTSILLALLIVLAGCSTTQLPQNPKQKMSEDQTPTSTSTSTSTTLSASTAQLKEKGMSLQESGAGLSPKERREVQHLIMNFYVKLENDSRRRQTLIDAAKETCSVDNRLNGVSLTEIENGTKQANRMARRMEGAVEIINENFNEELPTKRFSRLRQGVSDASKYAPLLGSYNRLNNAACAAAEKQTDRAIRNYQIAALVFGVDALLVYQSAFYRPAFSATGYLTNRANMVGFYKLRYLCGNRCYALAMSELHWTLRASFATMVSTTVDTSAEMGLDLSKKDVVELLDRQQIADYPNADKILSDIQKGIEGSGAEECANKAAEEGQESRDWGDTEELVSDAKSLANSCKSDSGFF